MKKDDAVVVTEQEIIFGQDENGFLKQQDPQPFEYTMDYKSKQSTNNDMSWLRLGWLSAYIPFVKLRKFSAVDVGSGNGSFVEQGKRVFKDIVPYDLTGDTIDEAELYTRQWDLVVFSDVLEHYHNIDDFWALQFKYAMISFPETPETKDLTEWRHYKPNEHIYMLNSRAFKVWVEKHGCRVLAQGCPEDMLRKRWATGYVNISTFLIEKI